MGGNCELAPADEVAAFWIQGQLVVAARGSLPDPCWDVSVVETPATIWPPEFAVEACRTAPFCSQVVTPYSVANSFPLGTRPDAVTVRVEGESKEVPVRDIPTPPGGDAPSLASRGPAGEEGYDEATGLSRTFSFDEALRSALDALPRWHPANPDDMLVVEVTGIEAWFGGIAGFNDLAVKVRQPKRSS